jgi:hypothetical protein
MQRISWLAEELLGSSKGPVPWRSLLVTYLFKGLLID